jgi:hypothetical protein
MGTLLVDGFCGRRMVHSTVPDRRRSRLRISHYIPKIDTNLT